MWDSDAAGTTPAVIPLTPPRPRRSDPDAGAGPSTSGRDSLPELEVIPGTPQSPALSSKSEDATDLCSTFDPFDLLHPVVPSASQQLWTPPAIPKDQHPCFLFTKAVGHADDATSYQHLALQRQRAAAQGASRRPWKGLRTRLLDCTDRFARANV